MIVSRETEMRLKTYLALLVKWQKAVNLVSPRTLEDAWTRHVLDSVQLNDLIAPDAKILFDLGSGAGFPGMVLAIMRPDMDVHLVESDSKKCSFLSAVSRETNTPVHVEGSRIEHFIPVQPPDILTARALGDLTVLLEFSTVFAQMNPDLILLFMKGANVDEEIEQASKKFRFELKKIQSKTNDESCILRISKLSPKSSCRFASNVPE